MMITLWLIKSVYFRLYTATPIYIQSSPPNTAPPLTASPQYHCYFQVTNIFFLGYYIHNQELFIHLPLPPFSNTAVFRQSRKRWYWGDRLHNSTKETDNYDFWGKNKTFTVLVEGFWVIKCHHVGNVRKRPISSGSGQ